LPNKPKAFEAVTVVQYGNRKFLKKYIVISNHIPTSLEDLGVTTKEEFVESRQLNHEVIIK